MSSGFFAAQANVADWLTAIGTVGAVLVALVLAGGPALRRWRKRPTLEVVTGLTEPFLRPISADGRLIAQVRLRVGIHNSGRLPATHLRAKLLGWWEYDATAALGSVWRELDWEPLYLHWVNLRPGDERTAPPEVTIAEGATDYLDLALLGDAARGIRLLLDDERLALFDHRTTERAGTWRIAFSLEGDDIRATQHTVEFTVDEANYFSAVRLSEAPTDSTHVGIFSLLRSRPEGRTEPTEAEGSEGT